MVKKAHPHFSLAPPPHFFGTPFSHCEVRKRVFLKFLTLFFLLYLLNLVTRMKREASDAFFTEWFAAKQHLIDVGKTMKSEPVAVPQFMFDEDIPYLGAGAFKDNTPIVVKHSDQTKCFASFLREYGDAYPRVAKAIRTMLVMPPNSSAIERGYSVMKEVISPRRSCLSERQAELCILLACNIPSDLSKLPLMEIQREMQKIM